MTATPFLCADPQDLGRVKTTTIIGVCRDCKEWEKLYLFVDKFGDGVYLCRRCYMPFRKEEEILIYGDW